MTCPWPPQYSHVSSAVPFAAKEYGGPSPASTASASMRTSAMQRESSSRSATNALAQFRSPREVRFNIVTTRTGFRQSVNRVCRIPTKDAGRSAGDLLTSCEGRMAADRRFFRGRPPAIPTTPQHRQALACLGTSGRTVEQRRTAEQGGAGAGRRERGLTACESHGA